MLESLHQSRKRSEIVSRSGGRRVASRFAKRRHRRDMAAKVRQSGRADRRRRAGKNAEFDRVVLNGHPLGQHDPMIGRRGGGRLQGAGLHRLARPHDIEMDVFDPPQAGSPPSGRCRRCPD